MKNLYQLKPEITKERILNTVSQADIFEFYGIQITHLMFCSPFRDDKNPTCTFKWLGDKLYFRDWAEDRPLDCFDAVMKIKGCSYKEALQYIYKEMVEKNHEAKSVFNSPVLNKQKTTKREKNKKSIIKVKSGKWTKVQANYLKQYKLTSKQIKKFNIFPITKVWVNDYEVWSYSDEDPAIGYYFGRDEQGNQKWKIYFFKRKIHRFLTNTNRINGWVQLPEKGDVLIITKSLKDVACLDIFNIPAIAMQNETTIPYDYIIDELNSRFNRLISFYDFDRTGVINANKLKNLYNIPYFFLTNGRFGSKEYGGAKDFSDYLKLKGETNAKELLDKITRKTE